MGFHGDIWQELPIGSQLNHVFWSSLRSRKKLGDHREPCSYVCIVHTRLTFRYPISSFFILYFFVMWREKKTLAGTDFRFSLLGFFYDSISLNPTKFPWQKILLHYLPAFTYYKTFHKDDHTSLSVSSSLPHDSDIKIRNIWEKPKSSMRKTLGSSFILFFSCLYGE